MANNADQAKPAAGANGRRPVRSFVRREGRLTASQKRALEELWPGFGIAHGSEKLDLDAVFGRRPMGLRVLEIGFGNGAVLAHLAASNPDNDYLGIEVHRPGVGHLLLEIDQRNLSNVRIISHDAMEVLRDQIPQASIDTVLVFFPDPWPKKRHHKRRIVQPAFLDLVATRLKPGGTLHLATDWENYAEHMLALLEADERFENLTGRGLYAPRPDSRPLTKFEQRGRRLGHGVWDLLYRLG